MENAGFAMPSIMVVDDEKDILIILEHYLRHRGYYFSTYSDPITKRLISRMHSSWSPVYSRFIWKNFSTELKPQFGSAFALAAKARAFSSFVPW